MTSVYLADGDGTFTKSEDITGRNTNLVLKDRTATEGDLNEDQILYIVNISGNDPPVHYGNGDGTFSYVTNFTSSSITRRIGIGDLNNDGVSDLLSVGSTAAQVLVGNITGGISPILDFSISTQSEAKDALS